MIDFVSILLKNLAKYKKVLELGSKKGDDLKLLDEYYDVVASEDEKVKTRFLKDEFIDIRVIRVDKLTLDTHKKFDCIFSNNCLDNYSIEDIKKSFNNQTKVLNENGIIFHIFDSLKVKKDEIINILDKNYSLIEEKKIEGKFYIVAKLIS